MSFKFFFFLLSFFFLFSCGVKGPPEIPPGTNLPSYEQKFLDPNTATQTR